LGLLEAFARAGGKGVAAPSANRFGNVSPTTAQAVSDELSDYLGMSDVILDGGACDVGVESTIIDCTGLLPRVLRPGAISAAMIEKTTSLNVLSAESQNLVRVSGALVNHYAPAAEIVLDKKPLPGYGFIAPANIETPEGVIRLASPIDDDEFAQILYSSLRRGDSLGLSVITVFQPNGTEIAAAIRDRLLKASAPKN
jgi:L-threonylcarbamoyladenylate synthase